MPFRPGHKINNGRKFSKEHKEKIGKANSVSHIGLYPSDKTRKKMSLTKLAYFEAKGPHRIAKMTEVRILRNSREARIWRKAVLERDGHKCIWCGKTEGRIEVDHIKAFKDYPELRFAIDNGRTLCRECHLTTDTYGGRINKKKIK